VVLQVGCLFLFGVWLLSSCLDLSVVKFVCRMLQRCMCVEEVCLAFLCCGWTVWGLFWLRGVVSILFDFIRSLDLCLCEAVVLLVW